MIIENCSCKLFLPPPSPLPPHRTDRSTAAPSHNKPMGIHGREKGPKLELALSQFAILRASGGDPELFLGPLGTILEPSWVHSSWSARFLSPAVAFDPCKAAEKSHMHTITACIRHQVKSITANNHETNTEPHREQERMQRNCF